VLSIVPERGCSSIEKLKEENVVEHYNAWTSNVAEH
jgi:hypothetical protein